MNSLFHYLANQHGEESALFRCNEQTMAWLMRYFEDLVIENKLSPLVIEGRCLDGDGRREQKRLSRLAASALHVYLLSCDLHCSRRSWTPAPTRKLTHFEDRNSHNLEPGPFI